MHYRCCIYVLDGFFGFISESVHVLACDDKGIGSFAISPYEGAITLEGKSVWLAEIDEESIVENTSSPTVGFVVDEVILIYGK